MTDIKWLQFSSGINHAQPGPLNQGGLIIIIIQIIPTSRSRMVLPIPCWAMRLGLLMDCLCPLLGSGGWFGVLRIKDGIREGTVAILLDGLPVAVEELEELLEHGGGLLLGETEKLHGINGPLRPFRAGTHVGLVAAVRRCKG
uniref:Uncharacterized protein n=1 Tax=Arundo donax TaxID=35708 RepID=A0A0A9DCS9_ARUDO